MFDRVVESKWLKIVGLGEVWELNIVCYCGLKENCYKEYYW